MLVLQICDSKQTYDPLVVDYLSERQIYKAAADKDNNIHILYTNEDEVNSYKVYKWSQKSFETKPSFLHDEILEMSLVCADEGLHCVYLTHQHGYVLMCYTSNLDGEVQKLGFGIRRNTNFSVQAHNESILALWQEGNTVYKCESRDIGKTFEKPTQYSTIGKTAIWGKIRLFGNASKMYCDSGCIDIEQMLVPQIKEISMNNKMPKKEYANGERAEEYSKREMLSALGSGELLRRLDAIEIRLDSLIENFSRYCDGLKYMQQDYAYKEKQIEQTDDRLNIINSVTDNNINIMEESNNE